MSVEKVLEVPKLLKDATSRQYLPDDQLGAGGFATCWRARMIDRRETPEALQCALKAVKSEVPKNLIQRFRLELAIQSKLDHKHIVKLYRAFTFKDVTYVALELCPNGSLTDMMRRRKFLTMGEIRRILFQLCGAVKYLHERDVVHRDIKAGNIFMDADMNIKLGDFGLAAIMEPADNTKELGYHRRTTFCGTPNYLAPEILSRKEGHGTSVDIWSIGILAYYLAVGRAPFHSKSKDEIYAKLRKGEYCWPDLSPEENEIPQDLRDLVGMILVEESRRPKIDEIVNHPFFANGFIPERLDPLCRTRRPRFARVNDSQYCTGSCPPNVYCTCDASQREYSRQRIYNTLSQEACIGPAYTPPSKPAKSIFLILADEVSRKRKLVIPLQEGLVYTGRLQAGDSQQSTLLGRVVRKLKMDSHAEPEEQRTDLQAIKPEPRPLQPRLETRQPEYLPLQPESQSRQSRPGGVENQGTMRSRPRKDVSVEQRKEDIPAQPLQRPQAAESRGTVRSRPRKDASPEQSKEDSQPRSAVSDNKLTMVSKPRRVALKFEICEDDAQVMTLERPLETARLRPLRSRIERGNRVRAGVEAIEKGRMLEA